MNLIKNHTGIPTKKKKNSTHFCKTTKKYDRKSAFWTGVSICFFFLSPRITAIYNGNPRATDETGSAVVLEN